MRRVFRIREFNHSTVLCIYLIKSSMQGDDGFSMVKANIWLPNCQTLFLLVQFQFPSFLSWGRRRWGLGSLAGSCSKILFGLMTNDDSDSDSDMIIMYQATCQNSQRQVSFLKTFCLFYCVAYMIAKLQTLFDHRPAVTIPVACSVRHCSHRIMGRIESWVGNMR